MNAAMWMVWAALAVAQPEDTDSAEDTTDIASQPVADVEPGADSEPADSEPAADGEPAADSESASDESTPPFEPDPDDPWAPVPESTEVPPPSEAAAKRQTPAYLEEDESKDKKATRKRKRKSRDPYESPQRFALEVKLGPYLPDIDRNYTGPRAFGPYAKVFGDTDEAGITIDGPSKGVMGAVAFEWQFLNPGQVGPLGLGFQFSVFTDAAKAPFTEYIDIDNPDDLPEGVDSIRSEADSVRFTVFPLALQLVYRFELFADRFRVPLVPYAKAGLGYAFWYSTGGDGSISENSQGQKARGGAWGYQLNAGGMLRLDFLERGSARTLDRATGINHTYIFGEYQFSQLDNFGRASSISLGDSTFFIGLAMEF